MSKELSLRDLEISKIIIGPHMTEKSYTDADTIQNYVFKVLPKASKADIKSAIENFFGVKVKSVRTLNVKGKVKTFKQRVGKRKSWKKAYVELHNGNEIDFVGAGEKG